MRSWIREGARISPERPHLIRRSGPNKLHGREQLEWVKAEVRHLIREGVLHEETERPRAVSPIRLVKKSPGHENPRKHWRMVVNLRAVNEQTPSDRFSMEKLIDWAKDVTQDALLFGVDITAAYHHIALHPASWQWAGIEVDGTCYTFRALPFGWSRSAQVFVQTMRCVRRAWRTDPWMDGVIVFTYFDDVSGAVIRDCTQERAEQALAKVQSDLRRWGFLVAEHKTQQPGTRLNVMGVIVDAAQMRIVLPQDKETHYQELAEKTAAKWSVRLGKHGSEEPMPVGRRHYESLVGFLSFAGQWIPTLRWLIRPLLWALIVATADEGARPKPRITWTSVAMLRQIARRLPELNKQGTDLRTHEEVAVLKTDASGKVLGGGWGAFLEVDGRTLRTSGTWLAEQVDDPVPLLELRGIELGLRAFGDVLANKRVRCLTDSMTVKAVWRNGGCRGYRPRYQSVLLRILDLAEQHRLILENDWIPRTLNVEADRLSKLNFLGATRGRRRTRSYLSTDWGIPWWIAEAIRAEGWIPSRDAFASNVSRQAEPFWSIEETTGCAGVDGLTAGVGWGDPRQTIWAVPPLALAGNVVRLLRRARARVVLCVPVWRSQVWWRELEESVLPHAAWTVTFQASQAERFRDSELSTNREWSLCCLGWQRPAH